MKDLLLRLAPWLAALPGVIALGLWFSYESPIPDWELWEGALESQVATLADVDEANEELEARKELLTERIELIRQSKAHVVNLQPWLDEAFARLPPGARVELLHCDPRRHALRLRLCETRDGQAREAVDALRSSSEFETVALTSMGEPPAPHVVVTWTERRW